MLSFLLCSNCTRSGIVKVACSIFCTGHAEILLRNICIHICVYACRVYMYVCVFVYVQIYSRSEPHFTVIILLKIVTIPVRLLCKRLFISLMACCTKKFMFIFLNTPCRLEESTFSQSPTPKVGFRHNSNSVSSFQVQIYHD